MPPLKSLFSAGAIFCLFLLPGCGSGKQTETASFELLADKNPKKKKGEATPEQEAILRVMEEDRQKLKAGFETFSATSQPSVVTRMAKQYIEHLEKADVKDCPQGFKSARLAYAGCWRKFHSAVSRLADQYEGTEFMNDLTSLFRTNGEQGKSLGGDLIEAVKKLKSAYEEMFKAADSLGIES